MKTKKYNQNDSDPIKESKLKDVPKCVVCESLGHTTLRTLVDKSGELGQMFYTISPDPEIINKMLPDRQKKYIDRKFQLAILELKKKYRVYSYSIHYELNKAMNLHLHGIILIDIERQGYNINIAIASKIFNKYFGREHLNSMISSRFEWIKDQEETYKYVNKENVYEPKHLVIYKDIVTVEEFFGEGTH